MLCADGIEVGVIIRRCPHEKEDWSPLMGVTNHLERQAVAQARDVCDVVNQLVMTDWRIAQGVSEKLLGCRTRRIVSRAGRRVRPRRLMPRQETVCIR